MKERAASPQRPTPVGDPFKTPPPSPPRRQPALLDTPPPSLSRSISAPPDQPYFPHNRDRSPRRNNPSTRSRTPSPASDSECDRHGALLRGWTTDDSGALHRQDAARFPTRTGSLKQSSPKKGPSKSKLLRSFSGGSNQSSSKTSATDMERNSYHPRSMSSLFHVNFKKSPELTQIEEFERIDASLKNELWYFAKELKYLMASEVERNRKYEEGELSEQENAKSAADEEELCCWRGLEHVWEGDDRSNRIRQTVAGIVHWYRDAKEMGYNDPDELRIVSKARTKNDRTKAQKKASADALYMKKLHKHEQHAANPSSSHSHHHSTSSGLSPKRMARRISKTFAPLPKLHWSPKPNKKTTSLTV
ncbi:expressed unknown protein [Seminavis robusta]|uniref:Uncharacterized protein n=1 Tax=Seminavis robusta TaxID=568900 RepID=A0A9N8E310_9STRA|nr:expressed unknown protein [Seminavis robusta]|eukprot:Sro598_g173040.1 n/a (362) ;mRNA; r:32346-33431